MRRENSKPRKDHNDHSARRMGWHRTRAIYLLACIIYVPAMRAEQDKNKLNFEYQHSARY